MRILFVYSDLADAIDPLTTQLEKKADINARLLRNIAEVTALRLEHPGQEFEPNACNLYRMETAPIAMQAWRSVKARADEVSATHIMFLCWDAQPGLPLSFIGAATLAVDGRYRERTLGYIGEGPIFELLKKHIDTPALAILPPTFFWPNTVKAMEDLMDGVA